MKKKGEKNGKKKYQLEKNSVRISLFLKMLSKIDKNNFDKNLWLYGSYDINKFQRDTFCFLGKSSNFEKSTIFASELSLEYLIGYSII